MVALIPYTEEDGQGGVSDAVGNFLGNSGHIRIENQTNLLGHVYPRNDPSTSSLEYVNRFRMDLPVDA